MPCLFLLDAKDTEIFEQSQKIKALEDACQDFEGTILQFRELVLQLQSELDSFRAETQNAQHESATAASQTAAMMSLNLKLQSTASKNQARNIDLEVKRIEAREARELLTIIQVNNNISSATHLKCPANLHFFYPTALPAPSLCRVRHGCDKLLLVLPASGFQDRTDQHLRWPDSQPPRCIERTCHRRPGRYLRASRPVIYALGDLQTFRDDSTQM